MPIYEFVCDKCDARFEKLLAISDNQNPKCPECDFGRGKKQLSACGVRPQGIATGSGGFAAPSCSPVG
jgi:putative FmdB family regulatory protein